MAHSSRARSLVVATPMVLESTGGCRKPVGNLLKGFEVPVIDEQPSQAVSGRRRGPKDEESIVDRTERRELPGP